MYAPSNFFSSLAVRVHVMEPYIRTDSTVALKKFLFSVSGRLDFHISVKVNQGLSCSHYDPDLSITLYL